MRIHNGPNRREQRHHQLVAAAFQGEVGANFRDLRNIFDLVAAHAAAARRSAAALALRRAVADAKARNDFGRQTKLEKELAATAKRHAREEKDEKANARPGMGTVSAYNLQVAVREHPAVQALLRGLPALRPLLKPSTFARVMDVLYREEEARAERGEATEDDALDFERYVALMKRLADVAFSVVLMEQESTLW